MYKITVTHKNAVICEVSDNDFTLPSLWDNIVDEVIEFSKNLHAVEGGRTVITLESDTLEEKS